MDKQLLTSKDILLIEVLSKSKTLLLQAFADNHDENFRYTAEFAGEAHDLLLKDLADDRKIDCFLKNASDM